MPDGKEYITREDVGGSISISEDVIGIIAVEAIGQVEGVAGITNSLGNDIAELFGKKYAFKGVRVETEDEKIVIDATVTVEYGYPVNTVAESIQTSVAEAVESMTGLSVDAINIHVAGIEFDKAKE